MDPADDKVDQAWAVPAVCRAVQAWAPVADNKGAKVLADKVKAALAGSEAQAWVDPVADREVKDSMARDRA